MKLAYVVRHIDSAGGRERSLTIKANYFAKLGYELVIVTMFQEDERTIFALDDRIAVRHLKLIRGDRFPGSRLKYWRYVRKALQDELMKQAPDITVSMWWGIEFGVLPFIRDGSRKILEFHFTQYMRDRMREPDRQALPRRIRLAIARWVEDRIVDRYDRLVVLTREDRSRWSASRAVVIPNALSFVSELQSTCSSRVVIAAGRLAMEKGFDRLIQIWAAIEGTNPDWSLRIFGDGPDQEALASLIASSGLKTVTLVPATPDLQSEMLKASIFVSTSRFEGFGMAITEAMQCGLPVVSYRTKCGPSEIIDDNISGFLVDEDNASAFVGRLRRLIVDQALRLSMGNAGRKISYQRYRDDVVMPRWKGLFEEVAARRSA